MPPEPSKAVRHGYGTRNDVTQSPWPGREAHTSLPREIRTELCGALSHVALMDA